MGFISDMQRRFQEGDLLTRLLFVNIGVFLLVRVADILLMLFNGSIETWLRYVEFPSSPTRFLLQPWSILTYMFLHYDVLHVLFNMLWLYWFGQMFLRHFDARKLFGVYLAGGIFGAIFFMLIYNIFPYYAPMAEYSYMLGASASVMAVVFGVSFYAKEEEVMLFLIGRIKIFYLALFVLVLDLLSITSTNAGGHLAHIGGALFGIWFASRMRAGKDITQALNRIVDKIANLFKPKYKPKMKVTYTRPETDYDYNARKQRENAEIDAILDKLKRSGYQSLSSDEKKQLFDASKK